MFKIRNISGCSMDECPLKKIKCQILYIYNCLTLKALNLLSVISNQCVPKPCSVTFEQKEVSK